VTQAVADLQRVTHRYLYKEGRKQLMIFRKTQAIADIQKDNNFFGIRRDTQLLKYRRTHPVADLQRYNQF